MKAQTNITGRLANISARHKWKVAAAWVGVLAVAFMFAGTIGDSFEQNESAPVTEADKANAIVDDTFGGDGAPEEWVVVESEVAQVTDPVLREFVSNLTARLASFETVTGAVSYVDGGEGMVTADGNAALIRVTLLDDDEAQENAKPVVAAVNAADADPLFRVTTAGEGSIDAEFSKLAEDTLARGELIGIAVALVILFVVFGAAVAAGLPVLLAVASILVAVGASAIAGRVFPLDEFVVQIITMIGLAVGIDYALFIVKRYREELAKGHSRVHALTVAGETSTRTVVVSGAAVVIALAGMLIMPDVTFRSFGMGAIFVVLAAVAAALTLLPAVISILGDKLNWVRLPRLSGRKAAIRAVGEGQSRPNGFWGRSTRLVMGHPVASVVITTVLLVATAGFSLGISLGSNGLESLPDDSDGLHAFHVLTQEFGAGVASAYVVVQEDGADPAQVSASVQDLVTLIGGDDFFGEVTVEVDAPSKVTLIDATLLGDFTSEAAKKAVERLRGKYVAGTVGQTGAVAYVGGGTASVMDEVALMKTYLPYVFGFVLASSFVLLMVVFRSIVVPLKAVLMNVLSVGAAYGLLVLVFQEGLGADILGFKQVPVIEFWLPLFLFSILFGLSMDYHVFMLSRIKERYDETGDNQESVAYGLRSTAGIITGAALIMVAVFGGFAIGDMSMFQQIGFGLAAAVIIDVTLIRSVLVPASMELLGDWNWYFPRWLQWLPRLDVEGRTAPSARTQAVPVSGAGD
jgi:RND superfamily putative drug exporter